MRRETAVPVPAPGFRFPCLARCNSLFRNQGISVPTRGKTDSFSGGSLRKLAQNGEIPCIFCSPGKRARDRFGSHCVARKPFRPNGRFGQGDQSTPDTANDHGADQGSLDPQPAERFASIDEERLAGDEARPRRGEEGHRMGDLLR